MNCDKKDLLLYAVTDRHWLNGRSLRQVVEESLDGGVTMVQLREKQLEEGTFLEEAKELQALCRQRRIPFLVNDNVDIALAMNADGVHVGQSDMEALDVRKKLGPDKIIGVSAQTVEQALLAQAHGADYLGVGAVFPTGSKDDAVEVPFETLKEIWEGDIRYAEDGAAQELSYLTGNDELDVYSRSMYPLSYDNELSRVEVLGADYLTVDYSGYEYTGGAHGYPYRSHYLFDLTTGEEKTLADLYQGSVDEFKDIVAQYSVQNWKDNPDPYFGWDSEDAAYADLYDNASLDMLMRYGTDGIVIEYSPYEYGPYASGYIGVEIPYEALNINL